MKCPYCYTPIDLAAMPVVAANYTTPLSGSPSGLPSTSPQAADTGEFAEEADTGSDQWSMPDVGSSPAGSAHQPRPGSSVTVPVSGASYVGHVGPYPILGEPDDGKRISFFGRSSRHDKRDLPTRVCTNCELLLPENMAGVDVITIGIIGSQHAGKSHYLTALSHELMRRQRLRTLGIGRIRGVGRTAWEFDSRYTEVYRNRRAHSRTTPQQGAEASRKPFAFRLDTTTGRSAMLLFHDVPGEWLLDAHNRATHFDFLHHLSGLIVLIDPLGMPAICERFNGTIDRSHFYDHLIPQAQLIEEITDHIGERSARNLPISVAISKVDVLRDLVEIDLPPDPSDADLLEDEIRKINSYVRTDILPLLDDPQLEVALEVFDRAVFHVVSALGSLPDTDGNIVAPVQPARVVDPVYRILSGLG